MADQKTFRFKLKVKNCPKVFKEGFEEGVLVEQEATFSGGRFGFDSNIFAMALLDYMESFREEYIEVICEEVEE
jgi:hypothetical protein